MTGPMMGLRMDLAAETKLMIRGVVRISSCISGDGYCSVDELVVVVAVDDHGSLLGNFLCVDDLDIPEEHVGGVTGHGLHEVVRVHIVYLGD